MSRSKADIFLSLPADIVTEIDGLIDDAYARGYEDGQEWGYSAGSDDGYAYGYEVGYDNGHDAGREE